MVTFNLTGDNKIKRLNGRTFDALKQLTWVQLRRNDCIDEEFKTTARLAEMRRVVDSKCGFSQATGEHEGDLNANLDASGRM